MEKDTLNFIRRSRLFQGLGSAEIEDLCGIAAITEKEYCRNEAIINQGEPVRKVGIIKKGSVIGIKYHFDGNTQILRIYSEGEVFLLDVVNTTLSTSPSTLTAQSDCSVVYVPFADLINSASVSAKIKEVFLKNCSEILSNELIRLMYKIDVLSKRTLRDRILTYLSLIRERSGSDTFDIGMNQEQFAQYLCVNRSVLSSELNLLRKEALIDYKGRKFTLQDRSEK